MSLPTRVLSWNASISSSIWPERSPAQIQSDSDNVPSQTANLDPPEDLWISRLQPRQRLTMPLVLSLKAAAEKQQRQQQQREHCTQSGSVDDVRKPDDNGHLTTGIQVAIAQDRSAIDGRRSIRALRIWDSVARRLEESASPSLEEPQSTHNSIEGPESVYRDSTISSQRSSFSGPPRSTCSRRDTSARAERRSRIRRSSYGVPSEADARHGNSRDVAPTTLPESGSLFPCPFRRRNPTRFNIREHEHCARTQFTSLSDLRNHIILHHQRRKPRHLCRRCGLEFDTQTALDDHLMMPKDQICEIVPIQPSGDDEDGISEETVRILAMSGGPDGGDWASIWRLVFPGDKTALDPDFHPVVELVEVEQALDDGQEVIKNSLQDKLRLLLPSNIEDSYCTFLAGQLQLVVEIHHANVMRQCLTKVNSPPNHPNSPTTTVKQSTAQDQGSLARKSIRRSRRSTIIPTRPTTTEAVPEVAKEVAFIQLRPRLLDGNTTFDSTDESISPISLPSRADPVSTLSPNADLLPPDHDKHVPPRDSRDSGIGIPCDVCESEACRCREIILALAAAKASPLSEPEHSRRTPLEPLRPPPPPPPKDPAHVHVATDCQNAAQRHSQILSAAEPRPMRSLQHQPKLRLRTTNIGLGVSQPTSADGFSPQSFKERVLRTHGVRQPEQVEWSS